MRASLRGILLAAACVAGCGGSGDDEGVAPPADTPLQGPTGVVLPVVTISGVFYLGDAERPAVGYEIWILDHTDGGMARFPLGSQGAFAAPLSIFRVGHLYTFHLALNDHLLGDLDFGAHTDGAQATLIYEGGYGFDLGEVIANVTSRGDVDADDPGLAANVGGGFALDVDSTATFGTLPTPEGIEAFTFRSQLAVFDPVTLLYAFYHRETYPERHAEALIDQSRVVVAVTTRSKGSVTRVYLSEGGDWLEASRLASAEPDTVRGASPLWSTSGFTVPVEGPKSFAASVYTGLLLTSNTFALFKVQPAVGPTLVVPRLLGRVHAVPPRPTAISLDGGAPVAIDYTLPVAPVPATSTDTSTATGTETSTATSTETSTDTATSLAIATTVRQEEPAAEEPTAEEPATVAQGLLEPFCYADAGLTLVYDPPLDQDAVPIVSARHGLVHVIFDYYGIGEDGRATILDATAADFPEGFAEALTDSTADPVRSWDPASRTATFTWSDAAAAAMSSATLTLWPELLSSTAGGDVTRVRLRVYFLSKDDPGEAASAFWLKHGC